MSPCCWMAVYIEQSRENVNDAGDRCRVHIGMPNYVGQQGARHEHGTSSQYGGVSGHGKT